MDSFHLHKDVEENIAENDGEGYDLNIDPTFLNYCSKSIIACLLWDRDV